MTSSESGCKLELAGLSKNATERSLKTLLEKYGEVLNITLDIAAKTSLVSMGSEEAAEAVIKALNGTTIVGSELSVKRVECEVQQVREGNATPKTNMPNTARTCHLTVNNVSKSVTSVVLKKLLLKYGNVTNISLDRSRSTAYVRMDSETGAEAAIDNLDGILLGGSKINIKKFLNQERSQSNIKPITPSPPASKIKPQSNVAKVVKLNITPVPEEVTEDEVEKLFAQFGKVVLCDIEADCIFVQMEGSAQAEDAIRNLNGSRLDGTRIRVQKCEDDGDAQNQPGRSTPIKNVENRKEETFKDDQYIRLSNLPKGVVLAGIASCASHYGQISHICLVKNGEKDIFADIRFHYRASGVNILKFFDSRKSGFLSRAKVSVLDSDKAAGSHRMMQGISSSGNMIQCGNSRVIAQLADLWEQWLSSRKEEEEKGVSLDRGDEWTNFCEGHLNRLNERDSLEKIKHLSTLLCIKSNGVTVTGDIEGKSEQSISVLSKKKEGDRVNILTSSSKKLKLDTEMNKNIGDADEDKLQQNVRKRPAVDILSQNNSKTVRIEAVKSTNIGNMPPPLMSQQIGHVRYQLVCTEDPLPMTFKEFVKMDVVQKLHEPTVWVVEWSPNLVPRLVPLTRDVKSKQIGRMAASYEGIQTLQYLVLDSSNASLPPLSWREWRECRLPAVKDRLNGLMKAVNPNLAICHILTGPGAVQCFIQEQ